MAELTINQLPEDAAPTLDDLISLWDVTTATAKKATLTNVFALLFGSTLTAFGSWTPVLTASTTNPTMGTGAIASGRYTQNGKYVFCQFLIQFGTAGVNNGTGSYYVSLPVAARDISPQNTSVSTLGMGSIYNASTADRYELRIEWQTTTTGQLVYWQSVSNPDAVTDTAPYAPAVNDKIAGYMMYEAA